MGAFRDFFNSLFGLVSDPIIEIKEKLIGPDGFLERVKAKIEAIDDVFDKHVSGPICEAISNIGQLDISILKAIEDLVTFLNDQKDKVTEFFTDFKGDAKNKVIAFSIERMQVCKCVSALDNVYNAYPGVIKEYPGITEYYNTRKEELKGEGMITFADLGLNVIGKGIVDGVNTITKAAYEKMLPTFEKYLDPAATDPTPEEALKSIAASGEFGLNAVVAFMLGHFLSPVLSTATAPVWEGMGQRAWKGLPVQLMDAQRLINLMHRFPSTTEYSGMGYSTEVSAGKFSTLEQFERWNDELKKHGLSDKVIQDYKDEYKFYPTPNDLVTWLAREVYESEAVDKYKLLDEWIEEEMAPPFLRAGVDSEQAQNFWKAHWQHPSFTQITEMLHRGLLPAGGLTPNWSDTDSITAWEKEMEKEVYEWFRLVEVPPHWRDKLIQMSYKVPTRVDVRRWWDLKTISEERLRELYHAEGYHGKDLEDYVLWTKIYVLSTNLRGRYSKGYITRQDVSDELTAAGMEATRVVEWTDAIVQQEWEKRVKKEKDLTKAEIVKGVKNEYIDYSTGQGYLQRLGYDEWEAVFILDINVEAGKGSPSTRWEFERLVGEFENCKGKKNKPVPSVLIELEKEYRANPKDTELELEYRQAMKDYYEK